MTDTDTTTYSRVLESMQASVASVWSRSLVERDARACVARIREDYENYETYCGEILPRPFIKLDTQFDNGLLLSVDWLAGIFTSTADGASKYRSTVTHENMTAAVAAMNAHRLMHDVYMACVATLSS